MDDTNFTGIGKAPREKNHSYKYQSKVILVLNWLKTSYWNITFKYFRNILIKKDVVKLGDSGFAAKQEGRFSMFTEHAETSLYMRPEKLNGNFSFNSDVW